MGAEKGRQWAAPFLNFLCCGFESPQSLKNPFLHL